MRWNRIGHYLLFAILIQIGVSPMLLHAQYRQSQQQQSGQNQRNAYSTNPPAELPEPKPAWPDEDSPASLKTRRSRLTKELQNLRRAESMIGRRHPSYADLQIQIESVEEQLAVLTTGTEGEKNEGELPGPVDAPPKIENRVPAFPGAVGFGATATGGRGGDVYHVTNLRDYAAGEAPVIGSFRHAIESKFGSRTIVFDTGGNIGLVRSLTIGAGNLTIAGQTAPGDGITIWGYGVKIVNARNIIIRGLRFRAGDFNVEPIYDKPGKGRMDLQGDQADPLEIGWADRIVIDHVSATWGIDETLTVWESTNVTIQNSILAESLHDSYHDKGPHGYGVVIRGKATARDRQRGTGGITYFGNLFSKHSRRSPAYNSGEGGTDIEFVNNVIYNWGSEPGHSETNVGGSVDARINYIGNYVIAGVDSKKSLLNVALHEYSTTGTQLYHHDTFIDADLDRVHDGIAVGDSAFTLFETPFLKEPLKFPIELKGYAVPAQQAYRRVLAGVGASLRRDYHDRRIIHEVVNRSGQIINSQDDLVSLYGISDPIVPLDKGTAPTDSDGDGMPDAWELAKGLDPSNARDGGELAADGKGYSNLELYLNNLFTATAKRRR